VRRRSGADTGASRFATFDCYGTLIDWNGGIRRELARVFGEDEADEKLHRYHELEPVIEQDGSLSYAEVLTEAMRQLGAAEADAPSLAASLPSWPAFPEVRAALEEVRARGWKLVILSNTDPAFIEASKKLIGVPFEETIVAAEIGSYKPGHKHWEEFFARTGADPARHVHVAASLFHDITPANELGIPSVWINRLGETPGPLSQPTRELLDLTGLADALDGIVPGESEHATTSKPERSKIEMPMTETRIDVQVESTQTPPAGEKHPNTCPGCGSHYRDDELSSTLFVCGQCGHHFAMPSHARIAWLTDPGSFEEDAVGVRSGDPLSFFDLRSYGERLAEAELNTGLGEALVIGSGTIDGRPIELAVMDFSFMGGSMGSAVGEKFVRAADAAIERGIPLLAVPSSGGARMQEGIFSLMQLPKTVAAVEDMHDAGLPFFVVMAHPTTAGVLASFASLGDVTVAEPGALIAFTGRRVIEGTTREKLPDDFGKAEQNLRFGHLDTILPRSEQRQYLSRLLKLFGR
jgi:acetyl-CoA carboxylase carboxyl transferase subunit beta